MNLIRTYSLSFTAASFRLADFLRVAEHLSHFPEDKITTLDSEKILNKGNRKTSRREMAEYLKRYKALTPEQKTLLIKGSLDDKTHITLLAIAKSNDFIRDFIINVVREKILIFDFEVGYADFRVFVRQKSIAHPELDSFSIGTLNKAQQTLFKILNDAGMLHGRGPNRAIERMFPSPAVIQSLVNDDPSLLRIFLMSDLDIENQMKSND